MTEATDTAENEDSGEIDITIETELIDVDGDGVVDVITETVTTLVDVDGDGVVDLVDVTTTTGYDLDGDGVPDVIESASVTGADLDGDGEISEDEIEIEETVAVRDDLVE